ncbi:hypothetical protein KDW_39340 [Dictyobacter vulcani]|uniref:TIR domain-containing protein n=2 Tax=Dictyobacter vulcani TaxID=2607529 RepID=A0A5J4KRN4_9CHLR|nr:hypothetical protein KDW_39340 [Dictyobacter vulcani]
MSGTQAPIEVFYSYASEDEKYFQTLQTHLSMLQRQHFISTWNDNQIKAGMHRRQTIDDHLENAAVILLLISPDFLASDYCYNFVMRRALQRGANREAQIVPILVRPCDWSPAPFAELQCFPRNGKPITLWENHDLAWNDVTAGVRQIITDLYMDNAIAQPGQETTAIPTPDTLKRSDFYQYVHLSKYIERPETLARIRNDLLADIPIIALTSAVQQTRTNALHGMGGIGKTIIARALCDDPLIQATFPDGIIWIQLGHEPEIIPRMRELVDVLGGTIRESAPTVNMLKNTLIKLLTERACLLILDDVWRRSHAEAFLVGGPRCRLLMTTRDAEIAKELDATIQSIPVMTKSEAISLLEEWAGKPLADVSIDLKLRIVERLGYLPLAVRLAGAQLQRKPPKEWLESFDIRKLETSRPEDIHDNLKRTLELSLEELEEQKYNLYVALTIFREDEATPQAGIEKLWQALANYTIEEAIDLLDDFAARALLEINPSPTSQTRTITIHSLLFDLMSMHLGEKRFSYHRLLIDTYRTLCQDIGWHTANDDGYLYDHLAYHLLAGKAGNELVALFANQEWLRVRVHQRNAVYDAYLDDLVLAWKYVTDEKKRQHNTEQEDMYTFAQCLRFLLIYTTINSLAENHEPELIAWAVKDGLWPLHRALSLLRKIPNPLKRAQVCVTILNIVQLDETEHEEVQRFGVETALILQNEQDKTSTLIKLLPFLTGERQTTVLEKCFTTLVEEDKEWQRDLLPALTPHLTPEQRQRISMKAIQLALAPIDGTKLKQAIQLTTPLPERTEIMPLITSQLVNAIGERSLQMALSFAEGFDRAEALMDLIPYLIGELQNKAIRECLQVAQTLIDEQEQMSIIAKLAAYLPEEERRELLTQSLQVIQMIPGTGKRAHALAELAPSLTGKLLDRALQADLLPTDEREQAEVLAHLASRMSLEKRNRRLTPLLHATLKISNEKKLSNTLALLAPYLTKKALLEDTLRAIEDYLYSEANQAKVLTALAPRLTDVLLERGKQIAEQIFDEVEYITTLGALAKQYPDAQRIEMQTHLFKQAQSLHDEQKRMEAFIALAAHLTEKLLEQYVQIAQEQTEEQNLATMLIAIAPS